MKQRIVWIDVVKTLTMLLVILGHCSYLTISTAYGGVDYVSLIDGEQSKVSWLLGIVTRIIYSFHMPLFMAMSGACLQLASSKNQPFVSMIKNKWHRLIIPFIFTTLLVSVPVKYISGYWDSSTNIVKDIVLGQLLLMGNSHLWFVVALFWIFIEHRFLLKLKINLKSPIVLFLLLAISMAVTPLPEFLGLKASLRFLVYFTLGYSFVRDVDRINLGLGKSLLAMVLFFVGVFLGDKVIWHFQSQDVINTLTTLANVVFAIIGMILMVAISKQLATKMQFVNNKVYKNLNRNSYDLYLYSDPFNYAILLIAFNNFGGAILTDNTIAFVLYFARFILTIAFAYLIILCKQMLMRQIQK